MSLLAERMSQPPTANLPLLNSDTPTGSERTYQATRPAMRRVLLGVLVLLATVHLLSSLPVIMRAWEDLSLAGRVEIANQAANQLLVAVRNLGFERGRTYVVLRQPVSPEELAADRAYIAERRLEAEAAMTAALGLLERARVTPAPALAARLEGARGRVAALREQADRDLALPPAGRDPALPGQWLGRRWSCWRGPWPRAGPWTPRPITGS